MTAEETLLEAQRLVQEAKLEGVSEPRIDHLSMEIGLFSEVKWEIVRPQGTITLQLVLWLEDGCLRVEATQSSPVVRRNFEEHRAFATFSSQIAVVQRRLERALTPRPRRVRTWSAKPEQI